MKIPPVVSRVITYSGEGCPWCKVFAPTFAKFTKEHPELACESLDVDHATGPQIADALKYKVSHLPTTVFLTKRGRLLSKLDGARSLPQLNLALKLTHLKFQ